jgi:hypothetical protein
VTSHAIQNFQGIVAQLYKGEKKMKASQLRCCISKNTKNSDVPNLGVICTVKDPLEPTLAASVSRG